MVEESNFNAHQKLSNQFESFCAITRAEMKAFIGIIIIMQATKLYSFLANKLINFSKVNPLLIVFFIKKKNKKKTKTLC